MNNQLQEFARNKLKEGLSQCTNAEKFLFMQMYSHKNLEITIDEVVNNMPADKLDWAMRQVQRTIDEKEKVDG